MTDTALLIIGDSPLRISVDEYLHQSQGFARFNGKHVEFDLNTQHTPLSVSRLHPDQINHRYWHYCDESAIASNGAGMRHCADLIWSHLCAIKQQYALQRVVLAVPSYYQTHQLELLLGVAAAAGLQVSGLVNKAVMSVAFLTSEFDRSNSNAVNHVDLQLHQTCASSVVVNSETLELSSSESFKTVSISAMQEALLANLQQAFVAQDRFDPLHHADTEQQLFDQLDGLVGAVLDQGVGNVSISYKRNLYTLALDKAALTSALMEKVVGLAALQPYLSSGVVVEDNGVWARLLMALARASTNTLIAYQSWEPSNGSQAIL